METGKEVFFSWNAKLVTRVANTSEKYSRNQ